MSSRIPFLSLVLALALSPFLHADTFVLKDGTTLEGEIISETEEEYVIRYQVSQGIMDNRTVAKADVESIKVTTPADDAFEAIAALVPTADRLTKADYDRMIEKQVQAFLEAFGSSKHAKKAREILATLKQEREVVAAGGLKLDGTWISPSDREANAYEIDARMVYEDAKAAAEAGQFVTALRALDKMHSDFAASQVYPDAVDLATRIFKVYGPRVEADLGRVDQLLEARKKELATLPPNEREKALSEIERKDAAYLAVIERDKAERIKWPILDIYHKAPMSDTLRTIDNETRRLENLDLSTITPAGPVYREAWMAAAAANSEKARSLKSELQQLRVPERYITALEEKLAAAEAPEPDSEATAEDADPSAEEEGGPASPDEEGATPEGDEPSQPEADGSTDQPTDDPAETEEGGLNFSTILFAVIALVLVIAVVTVFAGSGKKK